MYRAQRRRTSDYRQALLRYCQDPDLSIVFPDEEKEEIPEGVIEGVQTWHCHTCPLILSKSSEIRIFVPCGHVFCDECTSGKSLCPVPRCKRKVAKVSRPCIQEGEPIDKKAEAEKEAAERLVLLEKIRDIDDKSNSLVQKQQSQGRTNNKRAEMQSTILKNEDDRKKLMQSELDAAKRRYSIARFLVSIEDRTKPFPVKSNENGGKAYYQTAAMEAGNILRESNKILEKELADHSHRMHTALREKEALMKAVNELLEIQHEDDNADIWNTLKLLVSNSPVDAFESTSQSSESVSTFSSAGITSLTAFKLADVKAGQWMAVTGAGGGLGSMAIQIGRAHGLRIIALDFASKRGHCLNLGAEEFVEIDGENEQEVVDSILEITGNGVHAALCFAPNAKSMELSFQYARPCGIIVIVGIPKEEHIKLPLTLAVSKALQIRSAKVASRSTADEILGFVERKQVEIPIELIGLKELPDAFERLERGEVKGRIVIDLWK